MPASGATAPTWCSRAAPFSKKSAPPSRLTRIRVADRGLREGILTLMMKTNGTYRKRSMTRPGGASIKNARRLKVRVKTGKGRTVSQKAWLERQLNDPYVAEAKRLGYRSRAAFKLERDRRQVPFPQTGRPRGRSRCSARWLVASGGRAGQGEGGQRPDHRHRHAWHGRHPGRHHLPQGLPRRRCAGSC